MSDAAMATVGRMYVEEQRLRTWLGRIATSAGYNVPTLQGMARQALAGEPSDNIAMIYEQPEDRILAPKPEAR